jgi:hypothetical protein
MRLTFTLLSVLLLTGFAARAQVSSGTSSSAASALLELSTTNKGLLLPRLTQTQRNAVANPAAGLMIYQTDNTPGLYLWGGKSWSLIPVPAQVGGNLSSPNPAGSDGGTPPSLQTLAREVEALKAANYQMKALNQQLQANNRQMQSQQQAQATQVSSSIATLEVRVKELESLLRLQAQGH